MNILEIFALVGVVIGFVLLLYGNDIRPKYYGPNHPVNVFGSGSEVDPRKKKNASVYMRTGCVLCILFFLLFLNSANLISFFI